jgi:hypothetical protein
MIRNCDVINFPECRCYLKMSNIKLETDLMIMVLRRVNVTVRLKKCPFLCMSA